MTSASLLLALGALAGCGAPSIEMTLEMPRDSVAAQFDTSCVSAVQVYVDGTNYPDDDGDWILDCIPIDPGVDRSTYAKLGDVLRGQIEIDLPDSGLSGIEIYAHSGSCDAVREEDYDLIAHGSAAYDGDSAITVPLLPNLSCAMADVTVRPINILKLSATKDCAQAAVTTGKMSSSTLTTLLFLDELFWWGGSSAGNLVGGVATFKARSKIGAGMLTMLHTVDGNWASLSARPPANQQVCASAAEIEAATVPLAVARASQDPAKLAQSGAVAFGLVYGATGPLAGATVSVAPAELAQVVYLDMPAGVENGTGALVPRAGAVTGPSGLFAIYTAAMVDVTVSMNGASAGQKLGTASDLDLPSPPAAMIVKL